MLTGCLQAIGIIVASPQLGAPSILQVQVIPRLGITTASPTIDVPAMTAQVHNLSTTGLSVGSPAFGIPGTTGQVILVPVPLTIGSPVLNAATINQTQAAATNELAVGRPYLQPPVVTQAHGLGAPGDLTISTPQIGAATLTEIVHLYFDAPELAVLPPDIGVSLAPDLVTDDDRRLSRAFTDPLATTEVVVQEFNTDNPV